MTLFQAIAAPLCFALAIVLLLRSRKQATQFWKALLWALVWLFGGFIILWPNLTSYAASLVGIGRGTDLVLYISALLGFYAFQRIYARTRRLENILTEIVRRQALETARRGEGEATFQSESDQ